MKKIVNIKSRYTKIYLASILIAFVVLLVLLCLNWLTTPASSPEWVYTIEWINIILIPLLVLWAMANAGYAIFMAQKNGYGRAISMICWVSALVFFTIPLCLPNYEILGWEWQYFLSVCWGLAFLSVSIALFLLATHAGAVLASLLCIIASVALGLGTMEFTLLFSSQAADGKSNLSAKSQYAAQMKGVPEYESWTESACGRTPARAGKPLPAFHRLSVFDTDIFDVKYTFNERGWRSLPDANPDAQNDLLLFGCSFTFGFGLEDEQTWAWKLARLLGPDWQVENYGGNAYSVNHMLCMLEQGLISKPKGKHLYALFLAIQPHLARNEFFSYTPHYQMNESGEAEAGGRPRFNWALALPSTFNGSQLAREAGTFLHGLALKHPENAIKLYLAMLKKSAQILAAKYDTRLIVLLWPDMENLAPQIRELGLTVVMASSMLPDWNTPDHPGWRYKINPVYEPHPNPKATTEIAEGVATYLLKMAGDADK